MVHPMVDTAPSKLAKVTSTVPVLECPALSVGRVQVTNTGLSLSFWTATGRFRRWTLKTGSGASHTLVAERLMVRWVAASATGECRAIDRHRPVPAAARARWTWVAIMGFSGKGRRAGTRQIPPAL